MTFAAGWPAGSASPSFGSDAVHVWSMTLDLAREQIHQLEHHLSVEERSRFARFAFEKDRARFIAGHGMLRVILAAYLDALPSAIRFRFNAFGKPSVEGERALHFNFSHSDGMALCAVARGRALGVDVERIVALSSPEEIAERFFSARERAALLALPVGQRCEAFYTCWSRKEAYIKGRGLGMSLALDDFDVSLAPDEPAALLAVRGEADDGAAWAMHALSPAPGYAAALAVEGAEGAVSCYRWPAASTLVRAPSFAD